MEELNILTPEQLKELELKKNKIEEFLREYGPISENAIIEPFWDSQEKPICNEELQRKIHR